MKNLFDYIRKHDFEYLEATDRSETVTEVFLVDVLSDLPYDDFLDSVWIYCQDGEFNTEEEKKIKEFVEKSFVRNPHVSEEVRKAALDLMSLSLVPHEEDDE
ncbi:MAG: hypothetical protein QMD10_07135 [Desulfitobacteriaceae bacterium]|nr:hypothetical protein [Desulfitobacteriaceae bacterium]